MSKEERVLGKLEPYKVYYFFEEICRIPHGSKNLDGISSYLEQFAKDRGIECIRDSSNNIIMIKEATAGYENAEPVMLQGHMDMVAVKKPDCDIDLSKDSLRLKIDGDYIYAEGTSLGGDDGIAVAYILAIFDDNSLAHPRIEAVITTDEEIGMEGATAIDLSMLKSGKMLNIDSEEEGIFLTSCAGGARVDCRIPVSREQAQGIAYTITVSGLAGGHSGTEINKERGNAIKMLGRVLQYISETAPIRLAAFTGGEKDNAIPREATAVVYTTQEQKVAEAIAQIETILHKENASKESNLKILCVKEEQAAKTVLDQASTRHVIDFLMLLPNGVQAMSKDIEGLVETSLNVGIANLEQTELVTSSAVRSSIDSAKQYLIKQLAILSEMTGGSVKVHGEYPGWQFDPDSKLRAEMVALYREMFGQEPKVQALHAGLECGIMIAKIPGLDCVSFGPNIYDIHTTEEKLSISSTNRMWEYLTAFLEKSR